MIQPFEFSISLSVCVLSHSRTMSWLLTQMTQRTSRHYQQEDDLIAFLKLLQGIMVALDTC